MLLVFGNVFFFFLEMISFIFENVLTGCTLASEYPHFKSSPIDFTFQPVYDFLSYCKHNCCKTETLTLGRD